MLARMASTSCFDLTGHLSLYEDTNCGRLPSFPEAISDKPYVLYGVSGVGGPANLRRIDEHWRLSILKSEEAEHCSSLPPPPKDSWNSAGSPGRLVGKLRTAALGA